MREILALYSDANAEDQRKRIDGIRSVLARPITMRLPHAVPVSFVRGLEITLECEEEAFRGSGVFLLGAVLDRFFAHYVSLNSFTQTVVKSTERGELMRWPARSGNRPLL